jgi:uncharacterized protein (TIGR02246 family)
MSKYIEVFSILFLLFHSLSALEKGDEQAISAIIDQYADAWNHHAGKGFGEGFAQDADFVNIFGMHFSGREEIELRHIKILETFLKDSKLEILSSQLREIHPGLVIALVRWKIDGFRQPGSDLPGVIREGIFTQIFAHDPNRWEIVASQNTLIPN